MRDQDLHCYKKVKLTTTKKNIMDPRRSILVKSFLKWDGLCNTLDSWHFAIQAMEDQNCFKLFLEGVEIEYDSNTHESRTIRRLHCYKITTQMQNLSHLTIYAIEEVSPPEPTESSLPSAITSIRVEQAKKLLSNFKQIKELLSNPQNNLDYELDSRSQCLNEPGNEEIDDNFITHRNDEYLSFYDRLADILACMCYHAYRIIEPKSTPYIQITLMFYPLGNLWKDSKNVIRPYSCSDEKTYDLLQPLYGIAHLLLGIGGFSEGIIEFLPKLVIACFSFNKDAFLQLAYPVSAIGEGISNIIYGSLQLITSPLLLLKIPLRSYLSSTPQNEKNLPLDQVKRINSTIAILKKIKTAITSTTDMTEEKVEEIHHDCLTVSYLLAEIKLGSHKFEYRFAVADNFRYCNDGVPPFFRPPLPLWKNDKYPSDSIAADLLKRSGEEKKLDHQVTLWGRANLALNKTVPTLADLEEVGQHLDRVSGRAPNREYLK